MTPERKAAIAAETEREIAERFEAYGIPEPQDKAAALMRWLRMKGWRVFPALADLPGPPAHVRSTRAQQAMAEAREVVNAKRGNRPEQATP